VSSELVNAIVGGLLIGSASVLLLLLAGRVAGVSGILWGALSTPAGQFWRRLFVGGLLAGGALAHGLLAVPVPDASGLPRGAALMGGLLVGMGVRLGNGCTSGHGVCGIGLTSTRSLAATLTFMSTGMITVFLARHL
jgi:uncharacterized membrane protein YedE/YeeE